MYGDTALISMDAPMSTVSILNCCFYDVGGKNRDNDAYDSFGDAIYLGVRSGETNVDIINTTAIGKKSSSQLACGTDNSRIGITVENLSDKVDVKTVVNIKNSKFINFNRCLHSEANKGEVVFNIEDSYFTGDVLVLSEFVDGGTNVSAQGLTFSRDKGSFGGAHNMSYKAKKLYFKRSYINLNGNTTEELLVNSEESKFSECVITGLTEYYLTNSTDPTFNNCKLYYTKNMSNPCWDTKATFNNCDIISNQQIINIDSTNAKYFNCAFKNIIDNSKGVYSGCSCNYDSTLDLSTIKFNSSSFDNIKIDGVDCLGERVTCVYFPYKNTLYKHFSTSIDINSLLPSNLYGSYILLLKGSDGNPDLMLSNGNIGSGFAMGYYVIEVTKRNGATNWTVSEPKTYGYV